MGGVHLNCRLSWKEAASSCLEGKLGGVHIPGKHQGEDMTASQPGSTGGGCIAPFLLAAYVQNIYIPFGRATT